MAKQASLSTRLVTMIVMVLTLALGIVAIVAMFIMTRVLVEQIDNDLSSSGAAIAQQALNESISGSPGGQLIPSPYHVYIRSEHSDDVQTISPSMEARYGTPADPELVFNEVSGYPITVPGTGSTSWRTLWLPTDSAEYPAVAIAYPLSTVADTQSRMTFVIITVAILVILVGIIASYFIVQSALRPLRVIERTTQNIAYGDLSQRVPTQNLGAEVGQLANSFNVMVGQIEAAMSSRERSEANMRQFISDASHELRTPLASVRGYAELYRMGGVTDDKIPQAMERIESEARRMGVLVDDLLQLARLDESRALDVDYVNLVDVAAGAVMDFSARAPEYPIELEGLHDLEPEPVYAQVDKDKISQVIANLLSNVVQHTPTGTPVEVLVGSQDTQSPHGPVNMAVVTVRDHGPGIPPENREKVFERFFRVDTSRSRASGGSGLGLAIVSSIIHKHRGGAQISETPGGGTTITLTFPSRPPEN